MISTTGIFEILWILSVASFVIFAMLAALAGGAGNLRRAIGRWFSYAYRMPKTPRGWLSLLLSLTVENFDRDMRKALDRLKIPEFKASSQHPHGRLAAERAAVRSALNGLAREHGCELIHLVAGADEHGTRSTYHWSVDLDTRVRSVDSENALYAVVDADFYFTERELAVLMATGRPVVFLTILPETITGNTDEVMWTFDQDNKIKMDVRGGGRYHHHLYDWSADVISALAWSGSWFCCFPAPVYSVCDVKVRRVTEVSMLVLLSPRSRVTGWTALLARMFLQGQTFKRFKPFRNGYSAVKRMCGEDVRVEVSAPGSYVTAVVSLSTWCALSEHAGGTKYPLSLSIVNSMLRKFGESVPEVQLPTLLQALKSQQVIEEQAPYAPPVVRYSTCLEIEPKPMKVVPHSMTFIRNGCYVPELSGSMVKEGVLSRVLKLHDEGKFTVLAPEVALVVDEFVTHLVGWLGDGLSPVDIEDVLDNQKRRTQFEKLRPAMEWGVVEPLVTIFLKRETYANGKPPRVISMMHGGVKLAYAQYVYAVTRLLERLPFYSFGKSPEDIADKVASMCRGSANGVAADITRMDGNLSAMIRAFEIELWLRLTRADWHKHLIECIYQNFLTKAIGICDAGEDTFGGSMFFFWSIFARSSGSMETAMMNTLSNTLIYYYAKRLTGASESVARRWLGTKLITGGDDGLACDLDPDCLERAGEVLKFPLKVEEFPRGAPGITFLSRVFTTAVWDGDNSSWMDLMRQMRKYHVTNGSLTVGEWAFSRLTAYVRSDAKTPLISILIPLLDRFVGIQGREIRRTETNWWTNQGEGDHDWPQGEICLHEGDEYLADNMPGFNVEAFATWALECSEADDDDFALLFLRPPVCLELDKDMRGYVEVDAEGFVDEEDIDPKIPDFRQVKTLLKRAKAAVEDNRAVMKRAASTRRAFELSGRDVDEVFPLVCGALLGEGCRVEPATAESFLEQVLDTDDKGKGESKDSA